MSFVPVDVEVVELREPHVRGGDGPGEGVALIPKLEEGRTRGLRELLRGRSNEVTSRHEVRNRHGIAQIYQ